MAIEFKKNTFSGRVPAIWRGECKILPGGFRPANALPVGTVLRRGVPLYVDFEARTAAVCKTAQVVSGGSTRAPRVPKGHLFAPGDSIGKYDNGQLGAVSTVTSIDTADTEFDVLNLSAAVAGLAAGDVLTVGDANGNAYEPNAVVGAELNVDGKGIPTIDAAYEAVVLAPALGVPVLSGWLNGILLKANPNIIFIKQ